MGELFAGRYEFLDPLGEGGMASVWRVWDARERRVVAAKVLRQADAVSMLRFVREQAVRVHHPHVLTPIGWAGEDDRVLFTMPIVDGGSVATLVGDYGSLPPRLTAEILRQVLAALDTVHTAGVVHRDVKPANLLLIATGHGRPHVLLSDFGIAIDLRGPRFTETGAFVGTPGYLAPELAAGAEPHPTADLYAAGQVALFMLTGHRPSGPDTAARPAGVPDTLWDLIGRLTSAHPSDRPQSAIETAAALRAADLAWIDQPNYEIDIFSHLTDDPAGRSQLVATASGAVLVEPGGSTSGAARLRQEPRGDADPRSARANLDHAVPAQTPDSSPTPEPIIHEAAAPSGWADRGVRSRAVLAALVAAVLAGLVLLWSPWRISRTDGASTPPETRSSVTAAASPIGASSPATETNAPSPMASVTPDTHGSVRVGTVVATVGQPCEFSNVGVRETTLDGAPVVCQRRADGSYVWDPPPS